VTPVEVLRLISKELAKADCQFAVCGGLAASIYRSSMRTTVDVDIALAIPGATGGQSERELALKFLDQLGIKALVGWTPGIALETESSVFFVVGQPGQDMPNVDFLLPNLPWVRHAVTRAQENLVDYGFARIPTVTPEDLIISKAFAFSVDKERLQDLSDIKSILEDQQDLDWTYLNENLSKLGLKI